MTDPEMPMDVQEKFSSYPERIRPLMVELRALILEVAEYNNCGKVKETLKWGEPSYQVKTGSPVRIDWKPETPSQYFLFFHCQSKLIDTFRELYSDTLSFEGNRAIVLAVGRELPTESLRHCLSLAMKYKSIKHLPMLGV